MVSGGQCCGSDGNSRGKQAKFKRSTDLSWSDCKTTAYFLRFYVAPMKGGNGLYAYLSSFADGLPMQNCPDLINKTARRLNLYSRKNRGCRSLSYP